jgi:hypothetical protein
MADLDTVRHRYRTFAESECRGYSDLYDGLSTGVAGHDELVRFIAERPVIQPNLFFAAVQYICGPANMPATPVELARFVRDHASDIAGLMERRRTQTNEVGRCAILLPALPPGPLALLEVGASAGLCLLLDRFCCDYGETRVGDTSSTVQCSCRLTGFDASAVEMPEISWRRGLDLEPVDLRDEEDARWLLACVWADHPLRRARLEAAIDMARRDPPEVFAGDLIDDLERSVRDAPAEANLIVFHSAVLPYVEKSRRLGFAALLSHLSATRNLTWISNEAPGVVASARPPAVPGIEKSFVVARTVFRRGRGTDEVLAIAHPHGREMTWLGPYTGRLRP